MARALGRGFAVFAPALFATACGKRDFADSVTVTGSSTVAPIVADAAKRYEASHPGVRIEVQMGGSSRGIGDAISGLAHLGMASRALKDEEADALTAHRIAVDGVCVVVHRNNPVVNLDQPQLVGIYTKQITNWSEVGGADAPIIVASKAEGRATLEVFLEYLGLDHADIAADLVVGENLHVINSIVSHPHTIGYVSIGTATAEAGSGSAIKRVAADGVAATMETVRDGIFPVTRPLLVVTGSRTSPAAQAFLDYLLSLEVHDIVERHYYVPIR